MPSSLIPAGAWLSGGLQANLAPTGPPSAAHRPIGPPVAADSPTGPPHALSALELWALEVAALHPTGPPGSAVPTLPNSTPLPREMVDPAWVYGGDAALLGQALRKSRAKITRPADDQLTPQVIEASRKLGRQIKGSNLWRWDPQFRIDTILCELAGRFVVQGASVWMFDPGASATPAPTVQGVFSLTPPPSMPDVQVDKVLRAAVEREDRLPEILAQANDFWPFFESVIGISFSKAPRLFELVSVAQVWAMQLLMGLKHTLAAQRPLHYSTLVMPVIPTPGHGSLPSGHATVAALNAELLRLLLYCGNDARSLERAAMLDRLARRIAFNRVAAGVHFPLDSLVGYALGTQLARVLAALGNADNFKFPTAVGDAEITAIDPDSRRRGPLLLDKPDRELAELGAIRLAQANSGWLPTPASNLSELWRRVQSELNDLRV